MKLFLRLSFVVCLTTALAAQAVMNFTATSANVSQPGSAVKINILKWSSDADRDLLVAALNPPPPPPPPPADAAGGDRGAGGRGGAAAAGAAAGRGGAAAGGGRGGGGRGGGRGGDAPAAPADPITALTAAIGKAPTVGYVWTTEVVGYSIKYAYRMPLPTGGERIILATDRRLGGNTNAWKPKATVTGVPEYQFTLIELRLDAKGAGEGKSSLTTKVVVDNEAKTIALENYAATPAVLQNIKR
jgi:hypothetical protein